MITRPTVFVLGAGASHPYGFPLGHGLLNEVVRELSNRESGFHGEVCSVIREVDRVNAFARDLRVCGRSSIDAFLETRQEFLDVGKTAIARVLSEYEADNRLTHDRPDEGWYHYLFDRMLTRSPDDFSKNQLSVITFNFERSFERALVLALQANYGVNEERAVALAQAVPVLHVHGQLGPLWPTEGEAARPYGPLGTDPIVRRISLQTCAKQIRIVHEEVEGPTLESARQQLREAKVVCFLGFGYHTTNLERLEVRKLGTPDKTVLGTNYQMPAGEWDKAQKAFPNISSIKATVLDFLKGTNIIHG